MEKKLFVFLLFRLRANNVRKLNVVQFRNEKVRRNHWMTGEHVLF